MISPVGREITRDRVTPKSTWVAKGKIYLSSLKGFCMISTSNDLTPFPATQWPGADKRTSSLNLALADY